LNPTSGTKGYQMTKDIQTSLHYLGTPTDPCILIEWAIKEKGWGEITFFKKDDQWVMDGETLHIDLIKKIINSLIDDIPRTDIKQK